MTLFILNESKDIEIANDLSVFKSLDDVSIGIEPIDVENEEYFLFDTEGNFYQIRITQENAKFVFDKADCNIDLAKKLVLDCFLRRRLTYSEDKSLEENTRMLGLESL
jgi:hypothetical protein